MKSKAHLKSHPLHPILVSFPIAFFIGTFIFDGLGLMTNSSSLTLMGRYLNIAGVIGALIAAIPGVIDYFFTVPPESSARKRATKHGLINVLVLLLFTFVLFSRQAAAQIPIFSFAVEIIGIILLSIAGWLGGTLVHRNQIGIDIRYANAGKWNEEYLNSKDGKVKVASVDELELNQMKLVHVNGKRIVIAKTEHGFAAFDDRCTHKGGSLAGGALICGTVQCPWHGSQFDCKTGIVKAGPAKMPIKTFEVKELNGALYIEP